MPNNYINLTILYRRRRRVIIVTILKLAAIREKMHDERVKWDQLVKWILDGEIPLNVYKMRLRI